MNKRSYMAMLDFKEIIERLGGQVVGEYIGANNPIDCICPNGHPCNPRPASVKNKNQGMCLICARKDPAIGEARFRACIAAMNGQVVGVYVNMRTPIDCVCPENHLCNPKPLSIVSGQGMCRTCAHRDSKDTERRFRLRVAELGGQVIGNYVTCDTKIDCICPKGHPCNPMPISVMRQGMCNICADNDPAYAEQKFRDKIASLNGHVTGKYEGMLKPIACICSKGHACFPRPANVTSGQGMCSVCANRDPNSSTIRFYDLIENIHNGKVIDDYHDSHTPVHCTCSWGHDCFPTPNNIFQGQGLCDQCQAMHSAFYVVTDSLNVKLGITSNTGIVRLTEHKRDGYSETLFFVKDLPPRVADDTESSILIALKELGHAPIKGREYFGPGALSDIMRHVHERLDRYVTATAVS